MFRRLCERNAEADKAAEGQGSSTNDGHSDQSFFLHLLLDDDLEILGLSVSGLNLQKSPDVLEGCLVLLDPGVADGQVVQVVSFATLVAVLEQVRVQTLKRWATRGQTK